MCDCFPGVINSHDKKGTASKPLPELEYIPVDDKYIGIRQFRAKLKQAKNSKSEPYNY